ncbi:sarcosine oxidase subunit delta [Amylibacter sp. SFDW26]|uniref:sarcosine oxidase subunit delta n=1 Tax=Amylibacter sp. SFDW26 TaxID=2652722 RepID=UPI001261D4C3|nr:sarcosine oxidase subunit delta [Amylibacter sp. SFDW26]KAB7613518.1 sarcosine oxidase subunit delta [Amylibacter sp. SFDW26]
MQIFTCPSCGARDEREFHFSGELGKVRPNTTGEVNEEEWATYLHTQGNELGAVREVWMHMTCAELFVMERDSVTMEVLSTTPLRKDVS